MASRGSLGGLSEATLQAALLMDASGKDDVLLETVGVGQAEVDIIDHADTVVLVLMPGSGDSIQALKAGVMEIPDVIVVNKSDHPLTDTMIREIRGVLSLGPAEGLAGADPARPRPRRNEGIDELAEKIARAPRATSRREGTLAERRRRNLMNEVIALAAARLRRAARGVSARGRVGAGAARRGRRPRARPGERRRRSCSSASSSAGRPRGAFGGWVGEGLSVPYISRWRGRIAPQLRRPRGRARSALPC